MPIKTILGIFCVVETGCFLLQNIGLLERGELNVAGHFDSVSGLAICLSLCIPVFLHGFRPQNTPYASFIGISILFCVVSVFLSTSRIGIIYIFVCFLVKIIHYKKKRYIITWIVVGLLFLAAFLFKTDSTVGRFFILTQTFILIMRKPLTGWGTGGFESEYMKVQADYFSTHPQSQFAILADNVHHPLNEFLLIATNYGLIALFVLFLGFIFIYKYYKKNKTEDASLGMKILTGIFVFSLFSYPFHYAFIWIMLFYALYLIFSKIISEKQIGRWVIGWCIVPLSVFGYFKTKQVLLEKEWLNASEKSRYESFKNVLPQYQHLYLKMHDNSHFLYNYAFVLREAKCYEEALEIAEKCHQLLADYDLSLLLGDINFDLKHNDEAIRYYTLAHNMCPNRFAPLCAIYDIYKSQGDKEKCQLMVKEILNKPIKIPSRETMEYVFYIRSEAKKYSL